MAVFFRGIFNLPRGLVNLQYEQQETHTLHGDAQAAGHCTHP